MPQGTHLFFEPEIHDLACKLLLEFLRVWPMLVLGPAPLHDMSKRWLSG